MTFFRVRPFPIRFAPHKGRHPRSAYDVYLAKTESYALELSGKVAADKPDGNVDVPSLLYQFYFYMLGNLIVSARAKKSSRPWGRECNAVSYVALREFARRHSGSAVAARSGAPRPKT